MNNYTYILDISGHNGEVDFEKVKAAGIEGVFLKCSEGTSYLAPKFLPNYEKALAAGLKVGAYHFLRSATLMACAKEGRWFGECCEGLELELGLALDIEHEGCNWDSGREGEALSVTDGYNMVNIFAQNAAKYGRPELYKEGHQLILYSGKDYFKRFLCDEDLQVYPKWLANPEKLDFDQAVKLVQYSWTGTVEGVEKVVDLNILLDETQTINMSQLNHAPHVFKADAEQDKLSEKNTEKTVSYRISGTIGEQAVDLTITRE